MEQLASDGTGQRNGGDGSGALQRGQWKIYMSTEARRCGKLNVCRALCARIYWKVSDGRVPIKKKGVNKMDRSLIISTSSDGSGVGEVVPPTIQNLTGVVVRGDPGVLIQSPTTAWVMKRSLANRTMWAVVSGLASEVLKALVEVDESNERMNTGRSQQDGRYGCVA